MGNICKSKKKTESISSTNQLEDDEINQAIRQSSLSNVLDLYDECLTSRTCGLSKINIFSKQNKLSFIDKLVLDTLNVIKELFDYDREIPNSMIKLQILADLEKGWISVINSMINTIPYEESLGPSIILLLSEGFSLPTKESILKLPEILMNIEQTCTKLSFNRLKCGCKRSNLSKYKCTNKDCKINTGYAKHRNFLVIISCLADKLSGPNSISLLQDSILNYLISNLNLIYEPTIILFSLIALEKFAQTNENKHRIQQILDTKKEILFQLESWFNDENLVKHQVGFVCQYLLDNVFIFKNERKFSYELTNNSKLNCLLNVNDACEYLKISNTGLHARCDHSLFESVRSTFCIKEGVWFYEVTLITAGVMQIGFATKTSKFLSDEGSGIGDDVYSISYDGCRQVVWYNSKSRSHKLIHKCWQPGDTLGCLIDLVNYKIIFYLNGLPLPPINDVFKYAKSEFYAAASFMSYQECRFNFGSENFKYPPLNIEFKTFNDYGEIDDDDRKILPKSVKRNLIQFNSAENSCKICFDQQISSILLPCRHNVICKECALQCEFCPICRSSITEIKDYVNENEENDALI